MEDISELFLFGEDFDAVLDILENEEELEEQFTEAVDNVQNEDGIVCDLCQKKCKSKAGLKRHRTVKHKKEQEGDQNPDFTVDDFQSLCMKAREKILERKIYPQSVRDELRCYTFSQRNIETDFIKIKSMYECLIKSGNVEKFYSNFYSSIVLNSTKTFDGLSRNAATLLSTKVADCMVVKSKQKAEPTTPEPPNELCAKEKSGLQYLGGYVLHKLYNKIHSNKSPQSEQISSILKAGKAIENHDVESQKLISSLSRGGLWAITKHAQAIFERIEYHFRIVTSGSPHNINISTIQSRSVCDQHLVSAYNTMLLDSELIVNNCNSIAKDVLHSIVHLYVTVRCFSLAKDVIQRHKIKCKQMKAKALRKEIYRASAEHESQERQY